MAAISISLGVVEVGPIRLSAPSHARRGSSKGYEISPGGVYWTKVQYLPPDRSQLTISMNKMIPVAVAIWISGASFAVAATIPAGTLLVARTAEPISSHERVGTPFKAELEQDVTIKGKVLVHAGTPVIGVVETSLTTRSSSSALSVNLKSISVNGRHVPVHTTGAYRLDRFKTKRGISVSGREWSFPYQTRIAFHLAQPIQL
jgi:hypothetical protein